MTEAGSIRTAIVLLLAATASVAIAEDSHCVVPLDPVGELEVTLVGVDWDR